MNRTICLAGLSAAVLVGPAYSQTVTTEPASSQSVGLEEIVVTAQRRAENQQNVPISVSAVSASALEAVGIVDTYDLRLAVPSLNVSALNGYVAPFVRGVGSLAQGPGIENPIATYVDGVYFGAPIASLLEFSNIEQVAVLKGPQGTLFGRNATGGLIQVTTKEPTKEFSGSFNVSYGNYQTTRTDAYLAGGITDTIRADIALQYTRQGEGWGRDIATGGETYDVDHDIAVRSKVVFEPSDLTKFTLIGDYSQTSNTLNSAALLAGTRNAVSPTLASYPGRYDTNVNSPEFDKGSQNGVSLKIDQSLGDLKLASITAYRDSLYQIYFDFDLSPINIDSIDVNQKDRQFSQELQLLSPSSGKLTWVVGAYFYDAAGSYSPFNLYIPPAGIGINVASVQKTNSISGYGQGTYEITSDTHLTAGVRYTSEKKSLLGNSTTFLLPDTFLPSDPTVDLSRRFDKTTFRASLDHRFTQELLTYFSFNRGFKSGGFNAGLPAGDKGYIPEVLDAYEVGVKSDLLDRTVRLNVAAFYYDYQHLQAQILQGATIGVINAGAATLYGLDIDGEARLTEDFHLTAGVSLLHDRYTSFPNAPTSVAAGGVASVPGSAAGNHLPFAASSSATLGGDYRFAVAKGDLHLNTTAYYSHGWAAEPDNVIKQKAFTQLNASAKWFTPSGHFNFGLYGKNLTNVQVQAYETTLNDGSHFVEWAPPLTFGVSAGATF